MSQEIARRIRDYRVPKNNVALFWFGQNGFVFKSPEGTLASIDLYLSDSCTTLSDQIDLRRQVPILLRPDEVEVDVFACTHNHQDHTDPETIAHLRHKDTMLFTGPQPSCGVFRDHNIESGRIIAAWPDSVMEHRDLRLTGTFALPTDATDLTTSGFCCNSGKVQKSISPAIQITTSFSTL